MSSGTLIEAPTVAPPDAHEWRGKPLVVDRGGVHWRGKVVTTDTSGAVVNWDSGGQGKVLWTEQPQLCAEPAPVAPAAAPLYPTWDNSAAVMLELARIRPFELNPREFQKLDDGTVDPDQHGLRALAASLVGHGQQQPIIVRPLGDGQFGLVDGERRYWAATLAGLTEVRVEVRELDDLQALVSTIAASSHAEAYPIADQARAVQFLRARDRTQEEIAQLLGTNQQTISTLSRYAQLPGEVQQLVRDGQLQLGHVRQLVRDHLLRVPKALVWIAKHAAETHASVRRLEAEIPFEDELPAALLRDLRPQPVMELEEETEEPPAPEATPPPGVDPGEAVATLQGQAAQLSRENGHELGSWVDSGTQLIAKCVSCPGTATIFTADTPMGSTLSFALRAPCQKTTPHRPGVEIVPPKPTLPELTAYQHGLRNYPPKAVAKEYASWRDATDPAAYQWRADACREELDRRRNAGVDPEFLNYCEEHLDYACRTCAAIARVRSMSEAAGENPEAMLQTNSATATAPTAPDYAAMPKDEILAEMEQHEAAGIELPAEQHNTRIDALVEKVAAEVQSEQSAAATPAPQPAVAPPAVTPAQPSSPAPTTPEPPTLTLSQRPGAPDGAPGCMVSIPTDCRDWIASTGLTVRDYLFRLKSAAYAQGTDATTILAQLEA